MTGKSVEDRELDLEFEVLEWRRSGVDALVPHAGNLSKLQRQAAVYVDGLGDRAVRAFAIKYLASEAREEWRAITRRAERRSSQFEPEDPPAGDAPQRQREHKHLATCSVCKHMCCDDGPPHKQDCRAAQAWDWTDHNGTLHPGYQYHKQGDAVDERERSERAHAAWVGFNRAIDEMALQRLTQWTDELLAAEVSVDGGHRTVTWGEATVEEHRERLEMFRDKAIANAEGAARHQQAILDIEEAGVTNLNEVVAKPAKRRRRKAA